MLAAGPCQVICQRQHLSSPGSHAAEVVAAGNNLHAVVPQNGLLQEARVRQGKRTPYYLDSSTSVLVAKTDTAVKKTVWLQRRAVVLQEGVMFDEIEPLHIPEYNMVADPFTKYLTFAVWDRHMWYVQNEKRAQPPHKSDGA